MGRRGWWSRGSDPVRLTEGASAAVWSDDVRYERGEVAADARIGAQMVFGHGASEREPVDDVDREAQPDDRPHDRAQWDEVRGCWVEWDPVDQEWAVIATPEDPSA